MIRMLRLELRHNAMALVLPVAVALFWAVRDSWSGFLFARPARFSLAPKRTALQPAE